MRAIDLNADVGEGFAEVDGELLAIVTSANVACGAHAGGEETARTVCATAAELGTTVGAHVGYPDREGFGRRELGLPAAAIEVEAERQIAALQAWSGGRVAYVKPHGALYQRASVDRECAAAVVRAAGGLPMLAFPGSQLLELAGKLGVPEGYADRGYAADGSLVPRGEAGAILDPSAAVQQALRLARAGGVRSLCIHGDTPGAGALARHVRDEIEAAGIDLAPFA